jgi:hypothetical protein
VLGTATKLTDVMAAQGKSVIAHQGLHLQKVVLPMQMFIKFGCCEKAFVAAKTSVGQTVAQHGILYLH